MEEEFDFSGNLNEGQIKPEVHIEKNYEIPIQRKREVYNTDDNTKNGMKMLGIIILILLVLDSFVFFYYVDGEKFKTNIDQPINNNFNATVNSPTSNQFDFKPSTNNEYTNNHYVYTNITIINRICTNGTNISNC